ncbi:trypsin-like peptidase domain-containing protein [Candidatus Kaiserbacteria bacterium]|nr:trypsin-like peptidase domain-containing protein [Candidatus Kaiserbacteria bacterium]
MSWPYSVLVVVVSAFLALMILASDIEAPTVDHTATTTTEQAAIIYEAPALPVATTSEPAPQQKTTPVKKSTPKPQLVAPTEPAIKADPDPYVTRIKNPYVYPQLSDSALDIITRAAIINILCIVNNGQSVSGSGVVIDERGVVLTNAHVGQYVLLSEVSQNITCTARAGSPAQSAWKLRTLFMPSTWVDAHAQDLRSPQPTGTGEHDYSLLLLAPLPTVPTPPPIRHLAYDTREGVSFEGDPVLLASYPAGFVGGFIVMNNLYPTTTFGAIRKLYTFKNSSIDLLSLGGAIVAQGGSSGGAIVNRWGNLVGLIVTTSEGETTADRDLRAVTIAHVDRSIREHTGMGLSEFLNGDILEHANDFRVNQLAVLAQKLVDQVPQQ